MDVQTSEMIAMCNIVNQAVGIEKFSYPMYQNAPRPPVDNYAAIRCRHSQNPGFDKREYIEQEDGSLIFRTKGIRILTFDILFVRDGNEIVDFDNAFYRPDVKAVMKRNGFAALQKYPTQLKNAELETNWEIRKGITCLFNVFRTQDSVIDRMSDATVSGVFVADDKRYLIP